MGRGAPARGWGRGQVAVGARRRRFARRFGTRADPDRDRLLNRARGDPRGLNRVEPPLEGHHALGPELAHQLDLLLKATRTRGKVHPQRSKLDRVPANPDAEAELALAERVEVRRV